MTYVFRYKKWYNLFYKKVKVKGHSFQKETDRMDLFLAENKGIISLSSWSKYDMKLSEDFFLFQKEQMEEETGQSVKLKK